jgi:hypothetical protein
VLLETLGFVLKAGTCVTGGKIFRKNEGLKIGFVFPSFSGWFFCFCFFDVHNTKCLAVFLRLATEAASVITDFKTCNMCTSKDKHYF